MISPENHASPVPVDVSAVADAICKAIAASEDPTTANVRKIRKRYSSELTDASFRDVYELADLIRRECNYHWVAYEIVRYNKEAFARLDRAQLERLSDRISGWHVVDAFARTLSGPAWQRGIIQDGIILDWAQNEDVWMRRSALVSTVALNMRSHGGLGDLPRTLSICDLLIHDHEDTIVKAMSWAIRELIPHDPEAVGKYIEANRDDLAARVIREVTNKLSTGLKNPRPAGR